MKKRYVILGVLFLIGAGYYTFKTIKHKQAEREHKAWVATLEHTASDNVQILTDTITIDYLNEKRTLAIYLPKGYESDSINYSVLYFFDGESLFDRKIQEGMEWELDDVMDSLGVLEQEQSIIVGIYSSADRLKEYKPFKSDRWYSDKIVSGDQHAEWVVNDLKPWIDKRYRTKKEASETIVGGASLGGLMAYFMAMEYPETFGKAIVLSPSFWVNEVVYTLHQDNTQLTNQKLYFNAGELETPTVDGIQKMKDILIKDGMPSENIKLDVEKELGHWHITWKNGFPKAYPWIVRD